MSPIFDKARYSTGKLQYALQVKPGDVGKYVLLPGDPDRVARIGRHLDSVREIAFNREFRTCTGSYKGIPVSATSTGVGAQSVARLWSARWIERLRRCLLW